MTKRRSHIGAISWAIGLTLVACSATSSVPYERARKQWKRHGTVRYGPDTVLDAHATLKTEEWLKEYLREATRRAQLTKAQEAALTAQEARNDVWEIELVVGTYHYQANDFGRGERSMWKLALIGSSGAEVAPISVKEETRPRIATYAWFPELSPFHRAYVVTFPKNAPDGRPISQDKLVFRISSSLGSVEFSWPHGG